MEIAENSIILLTDKCCQQVYLCSSQIALIYFHKHFNFPVSIYTSATMVTSVGNFPFRLTVLWLLCLLFGPPLLPLYNVNKTHFSSDGGWIYHFPTITERTWVLKSHCSHSVAIKFCAFSIFQWLQTAKHTGIVTCLTREHNTMSAVKVRTRIAPYRDRCIDH